MIGIRVADVTLATTSSVRLQGKGRKQRTVPLWKETAAEIGHWLKYADLRADQPLVPNRSGRPMTRTNVADRLALAITAATTQCPRLAGRRISPHSWRHATAMHLCRPVSTSRSSPCGWVTRARSRPMAMSRLIWQ
ncbi:tyrosine-type recombinase/integrase [Zoogloea oleivorans]|uniref:tyrosine-type recombinase/integrase n=2 Tax=Rhodocyclales TaxID=206389 RepID=UPI001F29ED6D|nr:MULTISPECIES: tyrosine-type recombinase/integrase [Zoogloeaceae]